MASDGGGIGGCAGRARKVGGFDPQVKVAGEPQALWGRAGVFNLVCWPRRLIIERP